VPADKGEDGYSDGDVLIHAVIDALLGAAGRGDIGELFPPSDPAWKDACSQELLRRSFEQVKKAGYALVNLDCVVSCELPKIAPYRKAIRASLAALLAVDIEAVFVKGKTNEGCDSVGAGEAIEALAVCLLERV
jgi:2-C-methyl-D-erythritol 2,4-cyclodiphosphate synthase